MSEPRSRSKEKVKQIDRDHILLLTAAKLIGCPVEKFLAWRLMEDGSLVVIDYDGKKYQFSAQELEE